LNLLKFSKFLKLVNLKILAFDTSSEYCSIALWMDGEILSRRVFAGQRHSELLLPMLQELLARAGLMLVQLDGIAFGAGPGSFTGLRIACGVAQGLAFGSNLPVIGISTLEALAQQASKNRVITAIDAHMGEIYHAAYVKSADDWQPVSIPTLCLPHRAPLVPGDNWVGCGSGFGTYGEDLRSHYGSCITRIESGLKPHAREMTQLAEQGFAKGLGVDPVDATLIYIRNKVALKESER
jgi:tRNA threonylcarbamoyladenosine biosynthesis protein TsaB